MLVELEAVADRLEEVIEQMQVKIVDLKQGSVDRPRGLYERKVRDR